MNSQKFKQSFLERNKETMNSRKSYIQSGVEAKERRTSESKFYYYI